MTDEKSKTVAAKDGHPSIKSRMTWSIGFAVTLASLISGTTISQLPEQFPQAMTSLIAIALPVLLGVGGLIFGKSLATKTLSPFNELSYSVATMVETERLKELQHTAATPAECVPLIKNLNLLVFSLMGTVTDLLGMLDAVFQSSNDIETASEMLSTQADEQSEQTNLVATSTVELAATVQEIEDALSDSFLLGVPCRVAFQRLARVVQVGAGLELGIGVEGDLRG